MLNRILVLKSLVLATIIAYMFIVIADEHLGGFFWMYIILNLYNNGNIIYGLFPLLGISSMILSLLLKGNRFYVFLITGCVLIYPAVFGYAFNIMEEREFINEGRAVISICLFIVFSLATLLYALLPSWRPKLS